MDANQQLGQNPGQQYLNRRQDKRDSQVEPAVVFPEGRVTQEIRANEENAQDKAAEPETGGGDLAEGSHGPILVTHQEVQQEQVEEDAEGPAQAVVALALGPLDVLDR